MHITCNVCPEPPSATESVLSLEIPTVGNKELIVESQIEVPSLNPSVDPFATPEPNSTAHRLFAGKDTKSNLLTDIAIEWSPVYGEIVWVQSHRSMPFWPAYVFDPSKLPSETVAMASAALGRGTGRSSYVKKYALYMYASAHFDFAVASQMKDYLSNRDDMLNQTVAPNFRQLYHQAIDIADKETALPAGGRVQWLVSTVEVKESLSPGW